MPTNVTVAGPTRPSHVSRRRKKGSAAARTADVFGGWIGVTPLDRAPRAVRTARAQLTVLPLPDAARFRTFRQGTAAYRFVCRARGPVIVVRTGRAIGRVRLAARAA